MAEPLTLEELKQRIDVVRDDIDDVLLGLIVAGREWVETYTGLTVNGDNVVQRFDRFCLRMSLLVAPATDDAFMVSYVDATGEPVEIGGCRLLDTSRPIRLLPPAGETWPTDASGITVTVNSVPETFKASIALYVRAMHEDGSVSEGYRAALEALCHPYRMHLV